MGTAEPVPNAGLVEADSKVADESVVDGKETTRVHDKEEGEKSSSGNDNSNDGDDRTSVTDAPVGGDSNDIEAQQQSSSAATPAPIYSSFTTGEKRLIVLGAALSAFFSPMSAQIYFPALNAIAQDMHVSSSKVNLTITTYMIFQGIVPMFIGSLADRAGRRPAYAACFVIYLGANIGLALAPDFGALMGLRCLQSAGSSSTVSLCVAVVADVVTSAERGQYVGYTTVPVVLATSLGPVLGGVLSQYLGWRSIFWFLAILAGIAVFLIVVFLPETCRLIVGDGSITPPLMYRSVWQILKRSRRRRRDEAASLERAPSATDGATQKRFTLKGFNVLASLLMLFEKETGLLLYFSGIVFAGFYAVATAMASLFKKNYGYNEIETGLLYLPLAAGSIAAAMIAGRLINKNYERHCRKLGIPYDRSRQQDLSGFPIERARLEVAMPLLALSVVAVLGWGWAMDQHTHVAVPSVISAFLGVGLIGFNNSINALLVDIHPGKAGTATAANNLTRCLLGAAATAAVVPMMEAMGTGWTFTLFAGLYVLFSPALLFLMLKGPKWRAEKKQKEEEKKQRQSQKEDEKAHRSV